MTEEEKEKYEELKSLLYTGTISQYGKRKLIDIFDKQQKEIENLKELMAHKNGYTKQLEEDLFENASNYVVGKDKIREKIKEYKGLKEIDKMAYEEQIKPLQELLGEE